MKFTQPTLILLVLPFAFSKITKAATRLYRCCCCAISICQRVKGTKNNMSPIEISFDVRPQSLFRVQTIEKKSQIKKMGWNFFPSMLSWFFFSNFILTNSDQLLAYSQMNFQNWWSYHHHSENNRNKNESKCVFIADLTFSAPNGHNTHSYMHTHNELMAKQWMCGVILQEKKWAEIESSLAFIYTAHSYNLLCIQSNSLNFIRGQSNITRCISFAQTICTKSVECRSQKRKKNSSLNGKL